MNPEQIHRLHALRMDNDAARFAMDEMRPRFDTLRHRHENGTAPRAVAAFQLFQTPAPMAAALVALLDLPPGARVLEPSAGLGRILDALQPYQPAAVVAVEVAPQCAGELYRQDRPGVRILQRDFLTVTPAELGLFDAVAMNPPFHLRADIRHIQHALQFLKPGGTLAALCMDTHHRAAALQPLAATWRPLPAGSFKEAATGIAAVMLTIRKP
jgi:SAM-dependent methyltransferase